MFTDRLTPERFRTDESFGFIVVRVNADADWASPHVVWLAERLVSRLGALAQAYELPLMRRLAADPGSQVRFSRPHCEALLEEMSFVAGVVNDPLVRTCLTHLQSLASVVVRALEPCELIAEAP